MKEESLEILEKIGAFIIVCLLIASFFAFEIGLVYAAAYFYEFNHILGIFIGCIALSIPATLILAI